MKQKYSIYAILGMFPIIFFLLFSLKNTYAELHLCGLMNIKLQKGECLETELIWFMLAILLRASQYYCK